MYGFSFIPFILIFTNEVFVARIFQILKMKKTEALGMTLTVYWYRDHGLVSCLMQTSNGSFHPKVFILCELLNLHRIPSLWLLLISVTVY